MAQVFVSYAHADRARVEPIIAKLEAERLAVWWDRELRLGKPWDDQIEQAMEDAPVVLILWSAAARASEEVRAEAYFARELGKALPARIDPVNLPFRLARLQRVDLLSEPVERCEGWPKLVQAIREGRGMVLVHDDGHATVVTPSPARPADGPAPAWQSWLTPLLVIGGLSVVGLGQAVFGAQSLWPTMVGSMLCGGGVMHALMAVRGPRIAR